MKEEKEKERLNQRQSKSRPSQGHNRYEKIDENEYWKERNGSLFSPRIWLRMIKKLFFLFFCFDIIVAINDFQLDTRGTFEGLSFDNIPTALKKG